jgi:hypothetical protein
MALRANVKCKSLRIDLETGQAWVEIRPNHIEIDGQVFTSADLWRKVYLADDTEVDPTDFNVAIQLAALRQFKAEKPIIEARKGSAMTEAQETATLDEIFNELYDKAIDAYNATLENDDEA